MSKQADVSVDQNRPFPNRTEWNPIGKHYVLIPQASPQSQLSRWKDIAQSDKSVLITGETGTGKEELANLLVANSPRGYKNFHAINCAALEGTLFQSELFGHVKGSYTGATTDNPGRLAALDKGTIQLDEIGELPLHDQARLLRFIQTGEIERVGENRPRRVDVRVIATTNANVDDPNVFRSDLKHRFEYHLSVPPLRERPRDIILALCLFLWPYTTFTAIDLNLLLNILSHEWPGNLRDLSIFCNRTLELARFQKERSKDPTDFVLRVLNGFELPFERTSKISNVLPTYLQGAYRLADTEGTSDFISDAHIGNFNKLVAELIDRPSPSPLHPRSIPLRAFEDPLALPECYDVSRFTEICLGLRKTSIYKKPRNLVDALLQIRHLASMPPEVVEVIKKNEAKKWEDGTPIGLNSVLAWLTTCSDLIPKYGKPPVPSVPCSTELLDQLKLKPDVRRMFELRVRGLTFRDIAKELHVSVGKVEADLQPHKQLIEQLKLKVKAFNSDSPTKS